MSSTKKLLLAAKKIQPHLSYVGQVVKNDPKIKCARVSVMLPDWDEYLKMVISEFFPFVITSPIIYEPYSK